MNLYMVYLASPDVVSEHILVNIVGDEAHIDEGGRLNICKWIGEGKSSQKKAIAAFNQNKWVYFIIDRP